MTKQKKVETMKNEAFCDQRKNPIKPIRFFHHVLIVGAALVLAEFRVKGRRKGRNRGPILKLWPLEFKFQSILEVLSSYPKPSQVSFEQTAV